MTEKIVITTCGRYVVIRDCGDYGTGNNKYSVWIGSRCCDGQCDILVSDNASVWVLGDADDADVNRDQWHAATAGVDADVLIAYGREADPGLGDWLEDRWSEATETPGKEIE